MSQEEIIDLLEVNNIRYEISEHTGELIALYKMSTFSGNDCSEWIPAKDMADILLIY